MSEPTESAFKIRPAFVVWFLAGLGWLLIIAGCVLWWGLPRWNPNYVITQSPWFTPAFEAIFHGGEKSVLKERLAKWEPTVRNDLLDIAESRTDKKQRLMALEFLYRCASAPEITPRLIRLLTDPDRDISNDALHALSRHRHPGLVEPLMQVLPSLDLYVAWRSSYLLHELEVPFTLISTRLLDNPNPDIQRLGCMVLHNSPDPQAITALVERLGRFPSDSYIWGKYRADWAARALGANSNPFALDGIDAALANPDATKRRAAAQAFYWYYHIGNNDRIRAMAIRLTTDPQPDVQELALDKIARYPNDEVIAILHKTVVAGGEPAKRAVSNLADIASLHAPLALYPLIIALKHEDESIRAAAKKGLTHHGPITDQSHNAEIIALLNDPDPRVRAGAMMVVDQLQLTDVEQQTVDAHRRANE